MECTCSSIIRALGLTSGLAVAGVAQAQSVAAPTEFVPTKLSADVSFVDEVVTLDRGAERGVDPCYNPGIGCTPGGQLNPLTNSTISGFGDCGVFNPADNFVPSIGGTMTDLCYRGDYRNTGAGTDCSPPADADATVGWRFLVYGSDATGLPIGPVSAAIAAWDTDGSFGGMGNATVSRCVTLNTYGDTPGGRSIVLWHAALGLADTNGDAIPDANFVTTANTCYWVAICWDSTVTGNVPQPCNFRWLLHTEPDPLNPAGDGCVLFDDNPPDDVYLACNLICSVGDFSFNTNLATATPTVANNCAAGEISIVPPTNELCSAAIAIPCDTFDLKLCPILADPNAISRRNPPVSCSGGVAPDVSGTGGYLTHVTWYTFVPSDTRAFVSSCAGFNDGWPNSLVVYDPTLEAGNFCDAMAANGVAGTIPASEIGCSSVDCIGDGELCVAGLVPGNTYYLQVGSDDGLNIGELTMTVNCSTVPVAPNDECTTAEAFCFSVLGFSDRQGDTSCANFDPFAIACGGTSNGIGPGVWYIASDTNQTGCTPPFIVNSAGDGTIWRASLCSTAICGTGYDTQLNIYCGQCDCGLICVTGNDDNTSNPACGGVGGQSEVDWCTVAGETYWVFVHGFFARGCFELRVTKDPDSAGPCVATDPPFEHPSCSVGGNACFVFQSDATYFESEACGDDTNGGCTGGAFEPQESLGTLAAGAPSVIIAGQAFGADNFRDLDWYAFTLTERTVVTLNLEAEFNGTVNLFNSTNCVTNFSLTSTTVTPCVPGSVTATLNPGAYTFFVALDNFNGFPCGCSNRYRVEVSALPLRACCLTDGSCIQTTMADCTARGGTPDPAQAYCSGDGEAGVTYTRDEACPETLTSIAGIGTLQSLGLNAGVFIALPFEMPFFGELYDAVAVVSRGYLGFGDIVILSGTPAVIPDPGTPNNIAAGLWADLDPSQAPGEVWTQVSTGTSEFVAEFTNVGRFNAAGPVGSNTFQMKLNGISGCIRFLYAAAGITPAPTAGDTSAGVENVTGSVGLAVSDVALLGSTITCVDFCPTVNNPVCGAACDGDANGDGSVDVGDISYVIFRLGTCALGGTPCANGCDGDANGDGSVDVGDISYVIFRLGTCNAQPFPCP